MLWRYSSENVTQSIGPRARQRKSKLHAIRVGALQSNIPSVPQKGTKNENFWSNILQLKRKWGRHEHRLNPSAIHPYKRKLHIDDVHLERASRNSNVPLIATNEQQCAALPIPHTKNSWADAVEKGKDWEWQKKKNWRLRYQSQYQLMRKKKAVPWIQWL